MINSLVSIVPSCHSAVILSLGKPYSVTPNPNYPISAPPSDTTSLTDGKYSTGYFWTQKSTVGWQNTKTVEILIDLENESNISSIAFNTARGEKEAEVYYPAHIAAFVGNDREHFLYVGDLAIDFENQPGPYHVKRFALNNVGKRAQYVFLEIIPKGQYLFCDEIEIIEGISASEPKGTLSVVQSRVFTDKIRLTGVGEMLNKQTGALNNVTIGKVATEHILKIKHQILSAETRNSAKSIESMMFELRGAALKTKLSNNELLIQPIKPWEHLIPTIFSVETTPLDLSFLLPKGGYDSKAFSITNLSVESRVFFVTIGKAPAGVELSVYQLPLVKSATMEYVADPMVLAGKSFTLRSGETRNIFISAHGTKSGTWHNSLQIKSEGSVTKIPITTQIMNIDLPINLSLNSVNWGYLDFKPIRDRQLVAVADLLAHHTNVVVVPPAYLPITDSVKSQDYSVLEKYLIASKGTSKILLFANFASSKRSSVNDRYPFMANEWKIWFKAWYGEITKLAINAGISKENLYFYPYDEMDDKCISDFIAFASWVRKELPDIRLYATINNKNALKVMPYLDVAQIVNRDELLNQVKKIKTELWLYDARGPAKSLSPYSYYRLMAWKAFLEEYKGIGFWAYADSTGTAWDDFDGDRPDYAVIYEGEENTIVSSRRWEAWRMGIEDYELLTMYAKAKGAATAKALAKSVLDAPQDTTMADVLRRKILLELSN